jgi:hypothetical protein
MSANDNNLPLGGWFSRVDVTKLYPPFLEKITLGGHPKPASSGHRKTGQLM